VSNNPVYLLFVTPRSLAPLFLRLAVATIFFYHGAQKAFGWFGGEGWQGTIEAWGAETGPGLPAAVTASLILAELLIPLSLVIGFLTRPAALGVVIIMVGELYYLSGSPAFQDLQLPLLLLANGLALFFIGAGRLSADRAISANLLPYVG
jgi:Predicted membrane protein